MFSILPLEKERYKQAGVRFARRLVGKGTSPQAVNLSAPIDKPAKELPSFSAVLDALSDLSFFYLVEDDKRIMRVQVEQDADQVLDGIIDAFRKMGLNCFAVNGRGGARIFSQRHAQETFAESGNVHLTVAPPGSLNDNFRLFLEQIERDELDHLKMPRNNRWVSKLWAQEATEHIPKGPTPIKQYLDGPTTDEPQFEIDYVFSWVNADDPEWKKMYEEYKPSTNTDANSPSRFIARDDLLFALRALAKNAPWVRNVYVLTNCAPPAWLDTEQEGIYWVDHTDVFDEADLPTFSSHAIETAVHKIPGLSEYFIYSNDDFFLSRPTGKQDFFFSNGIAKTRLEGYGMVNGVAQDGQPDYLNGARNSAALLFKEFGVSATRLHTHSPQSMRKSVVEEMENLFEEDFQRTRSNKFRAVDDISVTGFLFPHYAYLKGAAVPVGTPTRLIQQNHNYERIFQGMHEELTRGHSTRFLSICINDGNDSHLNDDWKEERDRFLENMFPRPSRFER